MSDTTQQRPAQPLLLEIGCEEIPARMIARAADDLASRVVRILDKAGLAHGLARGWGGPRRLAVRVEQVQGRQPDRDEQLLGPSARVAFDDEGNPTRAALGFAKKQGIAPEELGRIQTDKGEYVGVERRVVGRGVGELLAEALPSAVEGMSFPKTMRWTDGTWRWVRPVHWVVALHGDTPLELSLFGIASGANSLGHRFLADGPVRVASADDYGAALREAGVLVEPAERRARLADLLAAQADSLGGEPVSDEGLLAEVSYLVEWPGVVAGQFDRSFLELPRELLITTLRFHQKCFSVHDGKGELLPGFLAVANTDKDPGGHVRRGNEWVVTGRLEDARFFWQEDRKRPLAERKTSLEGVIVHGELGSYAEKAQRMVALVEALCDELGLDRPCREAAAEGAALSKCDLVTGTVGEFPELQGQVGGLLLREEGRDERLWRAVYAHYLPGGPDDPVPTTVEGSLVALADKLDHVAGFLRIGKGPTGSGDPFGLRRATNGIFRIVIDREWDLSIDGLAHHGGGGESLAGFLGDRLRAFLRDAGYMIPEIQAVLRPQVASGEDDAGSWPLHDIIARLQAIRSVREREDFAHLADLTKRVDNILTKDEKKFSKIVDGLDSDAAHDENIAAAAELAAMIPKQDQSMARDAGAKDYPAVVDALASFIQPVDRFFEDVLVLDPEQPAATRARWALLGQLRQVLTRFFDIRELAGQADRRK